MTEKDLLFKLIEICHACEYTYSGNNVSEEDVKNCVIYLLGKINNIQFNRDDKDEWDQVRYVLYERLEKKSPQTTFELSLGLPEGVGTVVLDELEYGRMYLDENYQIGLKK
ncbi:hypothetical protein b3_0065 [Synechococcus phage B3]|nr:hypothetical protein b3_0065 [Synechococcus phage B3]QGT54683.1 hypothetical protein b23_0065 [Synechococcus phage B23]